MNLERQTQDFVWTGPLTFNTDDRVPALQAADVIAWASRRRDMGKLNAEFEPLNQVLDDRRAPTHGHVPLPSGGIEMLAKPVNNWISRRGTVPQLKDVISR
jgi:hypothetical protein